MNSHSTNYSKNKSHVNGHGDIDKFNSINYQKSFIGNELFSNFKTQGKTNVSKEYKNISLLDFMNLDNRSPEDAQAVLQKLFTSSYLPSSFFDYQTKEITREGLHYLNKILNDSVSFYDRVLGRSVGTGFTTLWSKKSSKDIEIKTHQEAIDFLLYGQKTSTRAHKQIHCTLLKIAYCYYDMKNHTQEFEEATKTFEKFKEEKFFPYFLDGKDQEIDPKKIKDTSNAKRNFFAKMKTKVEHNEISQGDIYFKSSGRIKSEDRIILKMLTNPEYSSSEVIKDIYGIRNETKSPKDALLLLQYMWKNIFNKSTTVDIKYKGVFGKTEQEAFATIQEVKHLLDPIFLEMILTKIDSFYNDPKKEQKNDDKYADIKITGEFVDEKGNYHPLETQINIINNQNETGYAHHHIYAAKNKIQAMVRLQGYCSEQLIRKYIAEAVLQDIDEAYETKEIPELLCLGGFSGRTHEDFQKLDDKKNKEYQEKAMTAIFDYIIKKEFILKIDSRNYVTKKQWQTFHQNKDTESIYPDIQVFQKGKRKDTKL